MHVAKFQMLLGVKCLFFFIIYYFYFFVLPRFGRYKPLLLKGVTPSLPPPLPADAAGARRKGKRVDFDVFVELSALMGRSAHYAVVGQAAFPSSSWGLGPVAREYLGRTLTLYKEFLIGGLSQHIKEDKGPDLCHTLVRYALMVGV
ncbi:hypothetical protein ACOSP7_025041 [Xanthoceras sorbifolium]